jgi:type I restriction enzyme M protein
MRKHKGLNGDLDRLPMLTWVMFLKFLDDMEQIREEEAKMSGKRFRPAPCWTSLINSLKQKLYK